MLDYVAKHSRFLLHAAVCIASVSISPTMKRFVRENNSANGMHIKIYDRNADLTDMLYRKTT